MTAPLRRAVLLGLGALPFAAATLSARPARAAVHEVKMLNRGAAGTMVFEPALVRARPGDTVRFLPTDPSHNAETMAGMLPAGVAVTKGAMNAVFALRVDRPGVYGIKCAPHYGMGMVALVAVGAERPNQAAARTAAARAPVLARRRFMVLFDQLG